MFYRLVNQCTVYFAAHITMYVFINCKYKRQGVKKKQRRKRNNYVYELRSEARLSVSNTIPEKN